MDRKLLNYALVKSLYDQGRDYADCFAPFVLRVLSKDNVMDAASIQVNLARTFKLEMPIHVIDSILKRAKDNGSIVSQKSQLFTLTELGVSQKEKLERESEVERRINALLGDIQSFFAKNGVTNSEDGIMVLLQGFILTHQRPLLEYVCPAEIDAPFQSIKSTPNTDLLIDYIKEAERSNPTQNQTLKDLFLGSLIATTVCARDSQELDKLGKKKFRKCKVYLDSNLILSMLGLHNEEWNKPAKELLKLLKESECRLFAFPWTISEICRLVNQYRRVRYRYPAGVRVSTIHSSLRRLGWKASDVKEFIIDIEDRLGAVGIGIDHQKNIDLDNYVVKDREFLSKLERYKPGQNAPGQNHDLASIDAITQMRSKAQRSIEDAEAIFLTSDMRLCRFNVKEFGHSSNGTIGEAIPDRLLTNILWLKTPKTELSLTAIISVHSRDLFVNRRVWEQFYSVVQSLHKTKQIDDDKVSILFYHSYIENILKVLDDSDVTKITPSFVLAHVEELSKTLDYRNSQKIAGVEKEFLENLDREVRDAQIARDTEWLGRIQTQVSSVRRGAEKTAELLWYVLSAILAIPLIIYLWALVTKDQREDIGFITNITAIGYLILLLAAGFLRVIRDWLKSKLSEFIYKRRLKKGGLLDLEAQLLDTDDDR